jgi:hypothetical protein
MKATLLRRSWRAFCVLIIGVLLPLYWPTAQAQSPPKLTNLLVELWPEYDRPEVLVIYRGQLDPNSQLPAVVTFRLPGYIQEMHAVAVEQGGNLVDASPDSVELMEEGDETLLTFATPSRRIQFEYYDPGILSTEGQTRQLDFQFTAPVDIDTTTFVVQEPFGAIEFSLTPPPNESFISADGLRYNNLEVAGLAADDTFSLTATYQRATDELSLLALNRDTATLSGPPSSEPVDLDESGPRGALESQNFSLEYLLIGAGVLLLVGTGVYWWWSSRARTEPGLGPASAKSSRRPARRKKRTTASRRETKKAGAPPSLPAEESAGFCHRCGAALRPDSNFCHICGAERRSD